MEKKAELNGIGTFIVFVIGIAIWTLIAMSIARGGCKDENLMKECDNNRNHQKEIKIILNDYSRLEEKYVAAKIDVKLLKAKSLDRERDIEGK